MQFYVKSFNLNHGDGYSGQKIYPHVELVTDNWDDNFNYETLFRAYYYRSEYNSVALGELKILYKHNGITRKYIDKNFEKLNESFCSLGQSIDYYINLKSLDSYIRNEILEALNDIAIYKDIIYKFKDNNGMYYSLRRFSEADKAFEEAKFILENIEVIKNLKFTFKSRLENVLEDHKIDFDFTKDNKLPNRINVLVGKNGTGKTKILSNLASILSGYKSTTSEIIDNKRPSFSKYIAISYNIFDNFNSPFDEYTKQNTHFIKDYVNSIDENLESLKSFLNNSPEKDESLYSKVEILEEDLEFIKADETYKELCVSNSKSKDNAVFSYVYCGLRTRTGIISLEELREDFISSYKEIISIGRNQDWKEILSNIIENTEILNEIEVSIINDKDNTYKVLQKLSSGQSIMLFIITEVIENIKDESLLLFDEPETHLHPNAISNFMRMLNLILDKFNSYAIVSTHSPLIIQEIPSKYVRVFQKNEDGVPRIEKLYDEFFGENISNITNYIFDVVEQESNYKSYFNSLVEEFDREQVLELFPNGLSFNALTYLNSLYFNKGE